MITQCQITPRGWGWGGEGGGNLGMLLVVGGYQDNTVIRLHPGSEGGNLDMLLVVGGYQW